MPPFSLRLAEAMSALGIFTPRGIKATSEIWGKVEFSDREGRADALALINALVKRLFLEGLLSEEATNDHVTELVDYWQLPMYNLEFDLLEVSLKNCKRSGMPKWKPSYTSMHFRSTNHFLTGHRLILLTKEKVKAASAGATAEEGFYREKVLAEVGFPLGSA